YGGGYGELQSIWSFQGKSFWQTDALTRFCTASDLCGSTCHNFARDGILCSIMRESNGFRATCNDSYARRNDAIGHGHCDFGVGYYSDWRRQFKAYGADGTGEID